MARTKEQKAAYDARYKREHYSRVVIDLRPEVKGRWQAFAEARGATLTQTVIDGVDSLMEREGFAE